MTTASAPSGRPQTNTPGGPQGPGGAPEEQTHREGQGPRPPRLHPLNPIAKIAVRYALTSRARRAHDFFPAKKNAARPPGNGYPALDAAPRPGLVGNVIQGKTRRDGGGPANNKNKQEKKHTRQTDTLRRNKPQEVPSSEGVHGRPVVKNNSHNETQPPDTVTPATGTKLRFTPYSHAVTTGARYQVPDATDERNNNKIKTVEK